MSKNKFNVNSTLGMKNSERIRYEVDLDLNDGAGNGHYFNLTVVLATTPLGMQLRKEVQDFDMFVSGLQELDTQAKQGLRFMAAEFLALYFEDLEEEAAEAAAVTP